jgi:ADP-heptose:LPS heptosyltransferase
MKKILVIKLGALGDFVLALAAMKQIRKAHPKAKITLLTTPPYTALAKASGYFNTIETDGRPDSWQDTFAMISRLKQARYDRVYDLQTSSRSSSYFYMMWPAQPQWSGIALGCALPHSNPQRDHMHTLERQADQLKAAGIWPDAPILPGQAPAPDLSWCKAAPVPQHDPERRSMVRPYALLVPGGSAHRPEKRWPAEAFAQLARALKVAGVDVVIIGGPQESALARTIQRSLPTARDLTGRTDFAQIAALGAKAALAVGNDTGPLHLIAAAGAPTIALFSKASDPALCAPRGHVTILQADSLDSVGPELVLTAARAYGVIPQT